MIFTASRLKDLSAPIEKAKVRFRAQSLTKEGDKALALPYIDARVVMERLDTVCGPENWQDEYMYLDKRTFSIISIKIDGEWIKKTDCAGDSDVEGEKGAASDAFKRAAVKWGIGRELYEMETPWVPCKSYDLNGKKKFSGWKTDDFWQYMKKGVPPKKNAAEITTFRSTILNHLKTTQDIAYCHKMYKDYQMTDKEVSEAARVRGLEIQTEAVAA